MKPNNKPTRGGKRPNSGRPKADYRTTTIAFRVKVGYAEIIKDVVKEKIKELETI